MKKFVIFLIALLLIIAITPFAAYIFRESLLQSASPVIADKLGLEIDELDIETIGLRKIVIPKFKAKYFKHGESVEVVIERLAMEIDLWDGPKGAIKSVSANYIDLVIDSSNVHSIEGDGDLRATDLIKSIPSELFKIEQLILQYQYARERAFFFQGSISRDQQGFSAAGEVSLAGYFDSAIDLKILQDSSFKIKIESERPNGGLHIGGVFDLEEDWLVLRGDGNLDFPDLGDLLERLEISLPVKFAGINGEFKFQSEMDLGLILDDVLQSLAVKIEGETVAKISAQDYQLDVAELNFYTECIIEAAQAADCIFRQPINTHLEFVTTPVWIEKNFIWQEKKFTTEINPSDQITLRIELNEELNFAVTGSTHVYARAHNAPIAMELVWTDFVMQVSGDSWSINGDIDLKVDTEGLNTPAASSHAKISARANLHASDKRIQTQILRGTKFILQNLNLSDFKIDKVEVTQQNNATLQYQNSTGRMDASELLFSLQPMELVHPAAQVKVDASSFVINKILYSDSTWQTQAQVGADQLSVTRASRTAVLSAVNTDIRLQGDAVDIQGSAGLEQGNTPLKFEGTHELSSHSGSALVEIISFPVLQNNILKSVIASTGLPLQLTEGNLSATVDASWGNNFQQSTVEIGLQLEDLAGDYAQNQFEGLDTQINFTRSGDDYLAYPFKISISNVNIGVPVTEVSFSFDRIEKAADKQPVVKLAELSAEVLDGSIYAEDVELNLNQPLNEFSIYLFNLSLEQLLALNQTEDLVASGRFDGELPIQIKTKDFSIHSGWIKADEHGGVIRYNRIDEVLVGNPNLELVAELLKDFRYNEMSAQIDLSPDGNLLLATKLYGRSPKSQFDKQVNLNFNIEFNLWKFLESARLLTRIDQDISEQIISKQRK